MSLGISARIAFWKIPRSAICMLIFFYILKTLFYIGVWLITNIMLLSGIQQSDSVIYIHVFILFQTPFSFRLLQNIEQSSLCCTVGSRSFSILNIEIQFHSLCLSLPHHPFPLVTVSFFSKSVSLFLFVSKFRCPSTEEWIRKRWYTHTMNIDEILLSINRMK